MNTEKIKSLLEKYYRGQTSRKEEQQLRQFFRDDEVPDNLKADAELFEYYRTAKSQFSSDFDPMAKIEFEKKAQKSRFERGKDSAGGESRGMAEKGQEFVEEDEEKLSAIRMHPKRSRVFDPDSHSNENQFTRWTLRIAAGIALLLAGFAAGQLLEGDDYASTQKVAALEQEVQYMKDALMSTGNYQTASAGERLSAVNASTQISENETLNQQITDILIHTMNNDENVNVRLAAVSALYRFRNDLRIKKALVNSLNQQDGPLMQMTLIDMLVEIKAKGAISEMEKMLVGSDTQDIVRERLQTGIAELKV